MVTYMADDPRPTWQLLLEAARVAASQGVRLRVVGLSGEPKMLAQIIELDRIFGAYGSEVELT